ncbi:MAG: branched-chain amino acid transaminase [Cyanobacteria bacterium P01_H01_bin.74]
MKLNDTTNPTSDLLSTNEATSVGQEQHIEYVFFENNFVPYNQASINLRSPAFLYGLSIFEGIRGYYIAESNSISVFRMADHYRRLLSNGRVVHMQPDYTVEELCDITEELILRNCHTQDIYIRPTLYKSGENITPSFSDAETTFCLWTKPLGNYLDLEKGLKICISNWRRLSDNSIPARIKAGGAYVNTALAVTDARKNGFDDAILLTQDGVVSEGSAMNLFLVKDNVLFTPGKTEDILEGITRDTIITVAENELGVHTVERTIDRTELYTADEAFFCGTGAEVAPIQSIDGRELFTLNQTSLTRKIQALYFQAVKNQLPKYSDWCSVILCKS